MNVVSGYVYAISNLSQLAIALSKITIRKFILHYVNSNVKYFFQIARNLLLFANDKTQS